MTFPVQSDETASLRKYGLSLFISGMHWAVKKISVPRVVISMFWTWPFLKRRRALLSPTSDF